ncbi:MAG: L-type lectin-domain containing protein [Candidatus Poribacteria bacterium]
MNFKISIGFGILLLLIWISAPALAVKVIDEDFNEPTEDFTYNGSAIQQLKLGVVLLTQTVEWQAGSLFFNTPYDVSAFKARFDFWMGKGTGADGLTFAVLDSAVSGPGSLGGNGGCLGYWGLSGFAIEFDTWQNIDMEDPSENHVGVDIDGSTVSIWTNSDIPELEDSPGKFRAIIFFRNGEIKVFLRNRGLGYPWAKIVDFTIPDFIAFKGYFGFTAATGGETNYHLIDNFSLNILTVPGAPAKNDVSIATTWGDLKTKD